MRLFIDATGASSRAAGAGAVRVFGMPLAERHALGALEAGLDVDTVVVAVAHDDAGLALPASLRARVRISIATPGESEDASAAAVAQLAALLADGTGAPVLVAPGDAVADARILAQLAEGSGSRVFAAGEGAGRRRLALLQPGVQLRGESIDAALDALVASGDAAVLREDEFRGYIAMLRRDLAPYVVPVRDEGERRRVERFLFWSNYKGSTDFMTRYVYPPFVWLLVRPLARLRVHPNWVTLVDILATFAAVPYFARGEWVAGLALAYLMSVLDSVDGKLARVTFTSSKLGEVMDHGLDIVHPPIWYLAWGHALAQASQAPLAWRASLWMLGLYVVDRIVAGVFKARHGKSIHGYTPFDERMRTFISRRNVNLPFFTLALAADAVRGDATFAAARACFYAIVAWQAVCLAFHVDRLVRFWSRGGAR